MTLFSYLKKSLIILALTAPLSVFAEYSMTIELTPEAPGPYEQVEVKLVSYSFDVNTAKIEWVVNGKSFVSGLGIRKINITTGGIGDSVPITVKASTGDGNVLQSGIAVSPQGIDIVWESPESYVPPFYEGKALPGEGAVVKVTALPNISEGGGPIAPENLSYVWYINDSYNDLGSGVGKQTLLVPLDILQDHTEVKVRVRSASGAVAEKKISIYQHAVIPTMYLYDYILGVMRSKMIENRFETTKDFTFSLQPYFLSTKNMQNDIQYQWLLDGLPVTPTEKTILTLQPTENSYGTKKLSIFVRNGKRLLQKAETSLEILFDTRK